MHSSLISVAGYANLDSLAIHEREALYDLAYTMGQSLVDNGYRIVSGGLGGIMEAVSKGGMESRSYAHSSIIGILPHYDKSLANVYIDTALPIGFDVARNISMVSVGDALIVIGGGSGTLSEIAIAWQLGKLIIALGDYGFGGEFKNRSLDSRRNDKIYFAQTPSEAIALLQEKLPSYQKPFLGIAKTRTQEEAKELILSHINTGGGGGPTPTLFR